MKVCVTLALLACTLAACPPSPGGLFALLMPSDPPETILVRPRPRTERPAETAQHFSDKARELYERAEEHFR